MDNTTFGTWNQFTKHYGQQPHTGCYLIKCHKEAQDSWGLTLILDGMEIREVTIAMASKRNLTIWCRKSQNILRYNMRQIIGEKKCNI